MQFASKEEIISNIVAIVVIICWWFISTFIQARYDKKHPNAPRVKGSYFGVKGTGYNMSKGELIGFLIFFISAPFIYAFIISFVKTHL